MFEILYAIGVCWAVDGDTVRCPERIRIWGLDCAEMSTVEGKRARAGAVEWLRTNALKCADTGMRSYERAVYRCDEFARYMIEAKLCQEWCFFTKKAYGGSTCWR